MKRVLVIFVFLLNGWISGHAQIVINEICPANADIIYDPNYFNYTAWVELYNAGNSSLNIGGYYLSDDPAVKNKWRIPSNTTIASKGYLLIWCDGMNSGIHTNFSLDADGEDLVLSNGSLATIDQIVFPEQFTNVSYGRLSNGGSTMGYMVNTTPNASNNAATGIAPLKKPEFSSDAGRYSGTQTVSITHSTPGVEIRYTTNG